MHSLFDDLRHVVELLIRHARIDTDPESIIHDAVRVLEAADNAVTFPLLAHLVETGMLDEVACKEHSGLYALVLDIRHDLLAIYTFAASHEKTEPARLAVLTGLWQYELILDVFQTALQIIEVMAATLDETRKFLQLRAADGRLHVCDAEVHPKVRVDVFVVVALRQFAVLAIEAMAAVVVLAGGTDAVAAPVAEGTGDLVQQRIVRIDSAALPHRHVMRRVEARRAEVADRSREILLAVERIGRAERVAVVLNEPEVMLVAERFDCLEVEWIAERMREHDSLRPRRVCCLELCDIDVVLRNRDIDKDRHGAVVHNRRNGRREPRSNGDDLIAAPDASLAEERRGQRHESEEIRRRAGVHDAREADTEVVRELLLECFHIAARGQPELEGAVDEILHLLMVIDAGGIGNAVPLMPRLRRVVGVAILTDKREYLIMQFLFCHISDHLTDAFHRAVHYAQTYDVPSPLP